MSNKMAINIYLWTITFNISEVNAPIKKHRVTEWVKKQDLYTCFP